MNIKYIAKLSGVSTTTVSRVLNDSPYVSDKTREKVLQVIEENDYIPNKIARNLHKQFSNKIGVIVADISNEFFSSAISGISQVMDDNGFQVLFYNTDEDLKKESKALYSIFEERLSGLIISPVSSKDKNTLEKLKKLKDKMKVPIVLLDRDIEGINLDAVFVDNGFGSKRAVNALIEEGHENIAIITGPITSTPGNYRYRGYIDALKENNLPIKEEYIVSGDFKISMAYEKTRELLNLKNPPTAIFLSNNMTSLGALKYLKEKGYKIGEDISIIGFDEINPFKVIDYSFSYVGRDAVEQGKIAAEVLLDRIDKINQGISYETQRIVLDCFLSLNGSEKISK